MAIIFSPSRYSGVNDAIPATRTDAEVIAEVQTYLQTAVHHGFSDLEDQESSCWTVFQEEEFIAEYLDASSWQIHAWYDRVRYFWRVDDITLDVTRDLWLKSPNPTISC